MTIVLARSCRRGVAEEPRRQRRGAIPLTLDLQGRGYAVAEQMRVDGVAEGYLRPPSNDPKD